MWTAVAELPLHIPDVYYTKPMTPPGDHGRGSHLAPGGPSPGDKTGPRSDPIPIPITNPHCHTQRPEV